MHSTDFQSCIDACDSCADACDACSGACLREDQVQMMARCIALDIDCAQACRFAAAAMSRQSEWAVDVCRLCADICAACADECGKHPADHCQRCAQACRACAEECERMAVSA